MVSKKEKLNKAINFVMDSRDNEGMWRNFLSRTHGESTDWVTSFSGLNLLSSGISKSKLENTAQSVLRRQRENGGFSYNQKIVPDADSTAFAIRFLDNFEYKEVLLNSHKFLLAHQNGDGGFGTYREENIRQYYRIPKEMSVEGWCSSTPDVTASALLVLPSNERARDYLVNTQKKNGSWKSYWWNSDVYATVHAIEALSSGNYDKRILHAQEWLACESNIPEAAFYIALSLISLSKNPKYNEVVRKRTNKLFELQADDGSWNTIPILRFPLPSNTNPWEDQSRWREDSKDQNRIFTTSTCIKALNQTF